MKAKVIIGSVVALILASGAVYSLLEHDHDHGKESVERHDEHEGHDHAKHDDHEGHDHAKHDEHEGHDHAKHDDHEGHDHAKHDDHEGHDHEKERDEHAGHDHAKHDEHEGHDHAKERDEHAGHDHEESEDSHDGHDHGAVKAIGEGKAIVEVDEKLGVKLSKEAIKSMELEFVELKASSIDLSVKSIVTMKDKKGVYRFRDGFFKLVEISTSSGSPKIRVVSSDLRSGDQVVVAGLGPLRVADIFSTDTSEYGHGH